MGPGALLSLMLSLQPWQEPWIERGLLFCLLLHSPAWHLLPLHPGC